MEPSRSEPAIETPLAQAHRNAGANMGVWFGCALPSDFGDWRAEYSFARKTVALVDKNYRAYLAFTGPDRARYLNAILTNNIKDLRANHGIVSLLLSPQGRILAEIETYALDGTLFCVSHAMIRERLIGTLEKFIIMDDVTLTDDTERFGTLAVEGPQASAVLAGLAQIDLPAMDELASADAQILDPRDWRSPAPHSVAGASHRPIPCRIVKRSRGGISGAEMTAERTHLAALWQILASEAHSQGGGPMGYTALNALRLEQGRPWFGYDFGDKQIPHEADLQDTHISYLKGCYTGQEIVERVRSRGQVNRRRSHLLFTGTRVPAAGEPLLAGDKEAGLVTRAAFSPAISSPIGMGYLRKENSSPGTVLQWAGGTATVAQFPEALDAVLKRG